MVEENPDVEQLLADLRSKLGNCLNEISSNLVINDYVPNNKNLIMSECFHTLTYFESSILEKPFSILS